MVKNLFLLFVCLITLCSCDTSDTGNVPTATPKPITQAFLGSPLKDFQTHFADGYNVDNQDSRDVHFLNHTNIFGTSLPDYKLFLINGKVNSVEVLSNAHNKGSACAVFIPKDKELVSTLITDSPTSSGAMTNDEGGAMTIYESKWLAKQFPPSAFVDQTNLTSSDQPQPLAKPGTLSLIWIYVSDNNSRCKISIGKNIE